MVENDFNKEKILSLEDIFKEVHLKIDKAFAEVKHRNEIKDEYNEDRFKLEKPTTRRVLNVLVESGGAHRFTDIRHIVGCSPQTLTTALEELVMKGFVRKVEGLYQASSPVWFVQKKRERKRGKS